MRQQPHAYQLPQHFARYRGAVVAAQAPDVDAMNDRYQVAERFLHEVERVAGGDRDRRLRAA